MIASSGVFEAVRRGYVELGSATPAEIIEHFENIDTSSMIGHLSNIKGILFEQEYLAVLNEHGISASLFETTNHPLTDISILNNDGSFNELQLKATDSASYIHSTLSENPDIDIVTTSEVFGHLDVEGVIDSGISNSELEEVVVDTLFDEVVNPFSPLSVIGWLFGLPL